MEEYNSVIMKEMKTPNIAQLAHEILDTFKYKEKFLNIQKCLTECLDHPPRNFFNILQMFKIIIYF
jgi:hypothetical protein